MAEINNCLIPDNLLYNVEYNVWLRPDDNGTVELGMTDIAQTMAGNIIHCHPKKVGKTFKAGKSLATVESGKWVGPARSPIGGEIVAVNEAVITDATLLNKSPYNRGWIVQLRPNDWEGDRGSLVSGAEALEGFKAYMAEKELGECIHCEGFEG